LIFRFTILLLFIFGIACAQLGYSFVIRIAGDTVLQKSIGRVDSLAVAFQSNADSINNWYNQQYNQIDGLGAQLQKKALC
jgi:hypothetical protein